MLQQLVLHPIGVGLRLVDLVDRHDDRLFGRLGVADRLDRLGHDAVVGRDHQDDDVGHVGAARAHLGEGGVARRIQEGQFVAGRRDDLVRADVLCDAAGFVGRHVGLAQGVQQAGLAVVHVAHDGDHRRPVRKVAGVVSLGVAQADLDVVGGDALRLVAELLHDQLGGVGVDRLGDGGHDAHLEQRLDHLAAPLGHAVGQFLHGDRFGHGHFTQHLGALLQRFAGLLLLAFALALQGRERPDPLFAVVFQRLADGQLALAAARLSLLGSRCRCRLDLAPLLAVRSFRLFGGLPLGGGRAFLGGLRLLGGDFFWGRHRRCLRGRGGGFGFGRCRRLLRSGGGFFLGPALRFFRFARFAFGVRLRTALGLLGLTLAARLFFVSAALPVDMGLLYGALTGFAFCLRQVGEVFSRCRRGSGRRGAGRCSGFGHGLCLRASRGNLGHLAAFAGAIGALALDLDLYRLGAAVTEGLANLTRFDRLLQFEFFRPPERERLLFPGLLLFFGRCHGLSSLTRLALPGRHLLCGCGRFITQDLLCRRSQLFGQPSRCDSDMHRGCPSESSAQLVLAE